MTTPMTAPPTASAEPDPERDAGAGVEAAAGRRRQVDEDRRDHERRHRAQELDDREHALEVGGGQREAGDEQRGRDGGAEPDPGQPRADQGQRLARGHLDAEDRDPGREEDHADQREVVQRAPA